MNKIVKYIFAILISFICTNPGFCEELLQDNLVEILKERNIEKPYVHLNYNYQSPVKIPIKISITEKIKSELDIYEGQEVRFEVQEDVIYKRKIKLKEGDIIKARVGTIIKSGMNGIPASVIFDNFEIENSKDITKGQISNTLEVFGQDRTYIVFPLKWALTILPPTGSLTNFIMGGHVKLKPSKTLKLYYHPEWL